MVAGLRVAEGVLKFLLPRAVRGKGKAPQPLPLGVEANQLFRQFPGGGLGPVGGLGPLGTAQFVEVYGLFALLAAAAADVFAHQIQGRAGHVQTVAAGVGDFHVVLFHPVHRHADDAGKAADAVVGVYHQVAGGQVGVGLQLAAAVVPLLADAARFACHPLGELALGEDGQTQPGELTAGAECAQGDAHLVPLRQSGAL